MKLCRNCNASAARSSARYCDQCGAALESHDVAASDVTGAPREGMSDQSRFGVIDDEGLAQAVREALSDEVSVDLEFDGGSRLRSRFPITAEHMAGLAGHLDAGAFYPESRVVRNLLGIEHASNLTSIDVGYEVDDIAPLRHLTGLTGLELGWRGFLRVRDLVPLAALTNLSALKLGRLEKRVDLSPIAHLVALTSLEMCGRYGKNEPRRRRRWLAEDLQHIGQLRQLRKLFLELQGDEDLTPLSWVPNLNELRLSSWALAPSLDGLVGLHSLEKLTINSTSVWSPASGNRSCAIALESIAGHPNLRELTLSLEGNEDLAVLSSFPALRSLNLYEAGGGVIPGACLQPLETLDELTSLTIDARLELRPQSLAPLAGLVSLKSLVLKARGGSTVDGSPLPLTALGNLAALENLSLQHLFGVRDLDALSNLSNLETLVLEDLQTLRDSHSRNSDVPLGRYDATNDSWDGWDYGGMSSRGRRMATPALGGLTNLPALRSVTLLDLPHVRSVRPLRSLPSLTSLSVRQVPAEDFAAMRRAAGLEMTREPKFGSKEPTVWNRLLV